MDTTTETQTAEQTKREAEERYNTIVEQQCALTAALDEAVRTIVTNMKEKVRLAHRQVTIRGDCGASYPNLSVPMGIRNTILEEITRRLQWEVPPTGPVPLSLRDIDWSCKRMQAGVME